MVASENYTSLNILISGSAGILSEPEFQEFKNYSNSVNSLIRLIGVQTYMCPVLPTCFVRLAACDIIKIITNKMAIASLNNYLLNANPMIVSAKHKTHSVTDVLLALEDIDLEDKTLFPIKPKDLIMWDEDAEVIRPAFESLLDLYFEYNVLGENKAYKIKSVLERPL